MACSRGIFLSRTCTAYSQRTCRDADPPHLGARTSSDVEGLPPFILPLAISSSSFPKRPESPLSKSYLVISSVMWATSALAAVGVLAGIALAADFDWSAIEPSEQLEYHPCYDGFQCARLSVPYDPRSLACRTGHLCSFFDNGDLAD